MDTRPDSDCTPCREFRDLVFHFQAEELSAAQRARLEEHLHVCERCACYLEVEAGFVTVLRAGLARSPAPPSLRERVCQSIETQRIRARSPAPGRRFLAVATLVAAAGIAGALLAPLLFQGARGGEPRESERFVVRSAVVVDEDCDRAGRSVEEQRHCLARSHLNGLRMSDGTYWAVSLDGPEARQLVSDVDLRGHRIVVEGNLYAPMRTLHLTRWRELRGGSL